MILRISGQITGQDVEMLRDLLAQEDSKVAIDLQDVLLVDREAVQFLARCDSKAVDLRNCPPYIREWIKSERVDPNAADEGKKDIDNA